MSAALLNKITIVLASPKDSKNVGAVCRAMKNMGLVNLAIAGDTTLDAGEIGILSVHAYDVFENAVYFHDLAHALRGVTFSAGITRRRGKFRKYSSLLPAELATKITGMKRGRIALVFGNEEAGLTDEELRLCHVAVHIPSSAAFPSLNLSHAVQIIAYELFLSIADDDVKKYAPISGENLDELCRRIVSALGAIGFFKQVTPRDMSVFFRDIFARAMLDSGEAKRIARVFEKIEGIAGKKTY